MSDESRSHFELERGGVRIELTGSWSFLQKMYRRIMRDVDRAAPKASDDSASTSRTPHDHVVWIIRCSDMMRRIYMAEGRHFAESPLHETLDPDVIGTLYTSKQAFQDLLPTVAAGETTIWAKLTEAGREELSNAEPS